MNWIYAKRKEREKAYTYGRTLVTPDRWEYFKCLALGEKWCTAAAEYACRRNPKILARLEKTAFGICYPMAAKKLAFGNKVASADTAKLNQQATCASALPKNQQIFRGPQEKIENLTQMARQSEKLKT